MSKIKINLTGPESTDEYVNEFIDSTLVKALQSKGSYVGIVITVEMDPVGLRGIMEIDELYAESLDEFKDLKQVIVFDLNHIRSVLDHNTNVDKKNWREVNPEALAMVIRRLLAKDPEIFKRGVAND